MTALGEGTLAPPVSVLVDRGDVIGEGTPYTRAPTPRPGPVMAIDIPRLKLHSGVVQTTWEAPPFTVGQIKGSADITQGNTVLIGHLTGAAGNVFANLDQLQPGDEITAFSRGLPYSFVVSRMFEGSNADSAPIRPVDADEARLTLMTCAGVWNPFTHDYSNRLWVIAEPPDQAAQTIASAEATSTAQALRQPRRGHRSTAIALAAHGDAGAHAVRWRAVAAGRDWQFAREPRKGARAGDAAKHRASWSSSASRAASCAWRSPPIRRARASWRRSRRRTRG